VEAEITGKTESDIHVFEKYNDNFVETVATDFLTGSLAYLKIPLFFKR
jgi:hypothetical protein